MKIGSVPMETIVKAGGRLDADFYLGDKLGREVARARSGVRRAIYRYRLAQRKLRERDEERARVGIVVK